MWNSNSKSDFNVVQRNLKSDKGGLLTTHSWQIALRQEGAGKENTQVDGIDKGWHVDIYVEQAVVICIYGDYNSQ